LQPLTVDYIDRVRGLLADGPDLPALWEKEHREEGETRPTWGRQS